MRRIEACIVNHDTSSFAELALRSLVVHHPGAIASGRLRVTIMDNASTDDGRVELEHACQELGAELVPSRWPVGRSPVNTHGDVLRDFVADHPDPAAYLFVDADAYVLSDGTVDRMAAELAGDPGLWAVQARFSWIEENLGAGASSDLWSGRVQQLTASIDGPGMRPFPGQHKPRCHPAFALVRNTATFRRVADVLGLSAAVVIAGDQETAGFADTFGLATAVMRTHELHHRLSSETVGHYFGVSYEDPQQPLGDKLEDCRRRTAELRRH